MSLITSESAATAIASVAQHLNWADIPIEHPAEGIERQMVVGNVRPVQMLSYAGNGSRGLARFRWDQRHG